MKTLTVQQLLTDEKYRSMTEYELREVIDTELIYTEYKELPGEWADDKATELIAKWSEETAA